MYNGEKLGVMGMILRNGFVATVDYQWINVACVNKFIVVENDYAPNGFSHVIGCLATIGTDDACRYNLSFHNSEEEAWERLSSCIYNYKPWR